MVLRYMWEGLKAPGKEWRRLYKVLHLTEHLLRFGSTGCVQDIKDGAYKLRELLDFSYNEDGTERGSGSKSQHSPRQGEGSHDADSRSPTIGRGERSGQETDESVRWDFLG